MAVQALGWTLTDSDRATRLLALTGLTPEALRAGIEDPLILGAVLAFLEAYEPDLTACAEALDVAPAELVDARRSLEG